MKKLIDNYGSELLGLVGIIGVVSTAILAIKATKKYELVKELPEDADKFYKFREALPHYIPAILTGVATATSIVVGSVKGTKEKASILGAYTLLERTYSSKKQEINDIISPPKNENITRGEAPEEVVNELRPTYSGEEMLFYDEYSERYFQASPPVVLDAFYKVNKQFAEDKIQTINGYFDALGIEKEADGDILGWVRDEAFIWIDFKFKVAYTDDGLECWIIETPPGIEKL